MFECVLRGRLHTILVHEPEERGLKDLLKRVSLAAEGLPSDAGFYFAEHDVLYGPGHFTSFTPVHAFEMPSETGWRFNARLGHYRRAPERVLSSMRGRVGDVGAWVENCLNQGRIQIIEPEGVVVPWRANIVDIRWGGNFTN